MVFTNKFVSINTKRKALMQINADELFQFLYMSKSYWVVPIYQRPYKWEEKHCERLFEDIVNTENEHFLGSLVLKKSKENNLTFYEVIDGQQRIISSLLFLKALAFYDENERSHIEKSYFYAHGVEKGKKYHLKLQYKIDEDESFKNIIYDKELKDNKSKFLKNYNYFKKAIKEYISQADKKIEDLLKNFEKLKIIRIELEENEKAQTIFETLNSTGKPLTQFELAKNFIIMSANDQNEIFNKYIKKISELLPSETSLEKFLKAFTIMQVEQDIKDDELYNNFKRVFKKEDDLIEFCEYFLRAAKYYALLSDDDFNDEKIITKRIKKLFIWLNKLQHTKVLAPFIMYILELYAKKELDEKELSKMLLNILNFLLGRGICAYPTNDLGKIFYPLKKRFEARQGKMRPSENLIGFLVEKFPSKDEFIKALVEKNIYEKAKKQTSRLLFILNNSKNPNEAVEDEKIQIEHIAPQSLTPAWKKELGENFNKLEPRSQKDILHTLGNLTLTGYNAKLSNKPFKDKLEEYKNSNFYSSKMLASNEYKSFSLENMQKRGKVLAKELANICKLETIDEKFIFRLKEKENESEHYELGEFDPTNTTLLALYIGDKKIKEKNFSWAAAYKKTLAYFYELNALQLKEASDELDWLRTDIESDKDYDIAEAGELFTNINRSSKALLKRLENLQKNYYEDAIISFEIKAVS